MVGGVDDGVLESAGVLETEVDLALLGFVGLCCGGADVGLEGVEAEGYDLVGVSIGIFLGEGLEMGTWLGIGMGVLTVRSGEMVLETEPCGHPFPDD